MEPSWVFTAVTITSEYWKGAACETASGTPSAITPFMTITKNAADLDRQFSEKAPFMFSSRMGLPDCHPVIGPEPNTNFLSAYDVQTVFSVEGITMEGVSEPYCSTDMDLGIGLVRELTATHTRPILGFEFSSVIATSLASFLDLDKCRIDIGTATIDVARTKAITATVGKSNIMTPGIPLPKSALTVGAKVAIVLAIALLAMIMVVGLRRYRKRKREHEPRSTDHTKSSGNDQLYLQQKAELEAEESGKSELHGDDHKYELQGSEVREMLTDANARDPRVALGMPELRGEEHAKELRAEECCEEIG
ncbi:MAG: hypothetical protein Q9226_006774 [Calogaya cf. arnoldii]